MSGGDTLEADGTMAQPRACKPAHESFARAAHSAPSQRVEDSFVAAVAISPAASPRLGGQARRLERDEHDFLEDAISLCIP